MRTLLAVLCLAVAIPATASGQALAWSGSLQLASGTYAVAEPLRTYSLMNGLSWTAGPVRMYGSLPLILQDGGTTTVGDPFLSTAVELYRGFGLVRSLEVEASAKAPLNNLESGVGTGEWDYAIGGTAALAVLGAYVFLDAAYWRYGDLLELELQDGLSLGAGIGVPVSRRVWISAMASRSSRILATTEPPSSVAAGVSFQAGGVGWSLMAGTGLSESAGGLSLSVGWRVPLYR